MTDAPRPKRRLMADILKEGAEDWDVKVSDIVGPRRDRYVTWARHEVMALTAKQTPLSHSEIGRRLGGRDHSTVAHGIRRHREREAVKRNAIPNPNQGSEE